MDYLQTICDQQLHYDAVKNVIWFLHVVTRVAESVFLFRRCKFFN
jgi:hypothetical protein